MKLRFKKLREDAVIPTKAHSTDAGFDMTAVDVKYTKDYVEYDTGIAFEIPEGYVGLCFPRSSVSTKDLVLANSVGVIDADYRGSIRFRFKPVMSRVLAKYSVGDRIGQIVFIPIPKVELEEAEQLSDTKRGEGGYGSSGK